MQLGGLRHVRLNEDGALFGVEAAGEPIGGDLERVLIDARGVGVIGRQRMPVGREEEALVLMLEVDPVLNGADVVTDV